MINLIGKAAPFLVVFFALFLLESGVTVEYADAKSKMGGRTFSRPAQKAPVQRNMNQTTQTQQNKGGFGRGLAGGLIGGALGAMLFGSLLGASGQGFGLLPILLLGGIGFFLYRRFKAGAARSAAGSTAPRNIFNMQGMQQSPQSMEDQSSYLTPVEQGIQEIQETDPGFDRNYFVEVASDVFFQVQAGWMRRDLDSYRHLLGETLAGEYSEHFEEMRKAGHINKLESIAIRKVEVINAGSDGKEDFVTVLFSANLLDYTVDDSSGELVDGSMTTPVKFAEEWTWARLSGTDNWKLEGIKEAGK
jgi:predicted lipid-binding transport protein (Tim44 family)